MIHPTNVLPASVTPDPNSSDPVIRAQYALITLLDCGVSITDPRVETLITLIRQYIAANPLSSVSPVSPTSDANVLPQQSPSLHPLSLGHTDGEPTPAIPIATSQYCSRERSLHDNQTAFAVARLVLERTFDHSKSHSGFDKDNDNALNSAILTESHQHNSSTTASALPGITSGVPTTFQIAREILGEKRRAYLNTKRKDTKGFLRHQQNCSLSSPQRPADHLVGGGFASYEPSFSEQCIAGIPADLIFQVKAQAEAFRYLIRGVDLPTELCVAARGTPPSRVVPHVGPILRRVSVDLDDSGTSNLDRSLQAPFIPCFDPRFVPPLPADHTISEEDVHIRGERVVPAEELEYRRLLTKAHRNHLFICNLKKHDRVGLQDMRGNGLDKTDNTVLQQHSLITNKRNGIVGKDCAELPSQYSSQNDCLRQRDTFSNVGLKKALQSRARCVNCTPEVSRSSVPISVSSLWSGKSSLSLLLQHREKRISERANARLEEIDNILKTSCKSVRSALLIEQKQLHLRSLQKKVRCTVLETMYRTLFRSGPADIQKSRIQKLKRMSYRGTPSHQSNLSNCYPFSAEASYQMQQRAQRQSRKEKTLNALVNHSSSFRDFGSQREALKRRLLKDLDRFFRDRSREEEKRRKKEQMDRIRALRNNNEDEYLELLKSTKNKRLIQLLRQTDEYLVQIGAQVERQKQAARDKEIDETQESGQLDTKGSAVSGNGEQSKNSQSHEDELSLLRKRRNDYYTISHTISEKVYQPKCLVGGKLKPYQVEGLEWLVSLYNNNLNGILADEMGLGKTIQTISLITYLVEVKRVLGPFLVIVPLSVISNWTRELEHWAPSLVKVVYKGDSATRRHIHALQMQAGAYNVLLTTYEFVVRDKNILGRIRWKYIIMDEGHRMKNAECKLALTLGAKYTSRNRLLLTGTPLQNNMTELWALLNFLLPTIFSSADTFETWFNAPFQESTLGDTVDLNEEENLLIISRLHQVLRPFMLRRLKTDVESHLPDKIETIFRCNMSSWQRVLYRQVRNKLGIASGSGNVGIKSFNNVVMQFKKVCNHPFLFYRDEDLLSIPPSFLVRASGKFELLDHVLRKLKRSGHRVLIFSQMTAALDYLEHFLTTIRMKHLRLDGTTKADDRQTMLELFNAPGSEYFCFLLSTRAGGLGLNLQTADTVIIFDSDWNPMMDLQAQDRAHRIGQTREVRVYRLICSRSIEVNILERATRKLQIESQVIQAGQFNNKSSDYDRHEMLKDLLRQQNEDDAPTIEDVTSLEEINRRLARSEDEYELFQRVDEELENSAGGRSRLVIDESELPDWVFKPEREEKQKKQHDADYDIEHGRGRRKRKPVIYDDNLTEREWTLAIEEDGDTVNAMKRKRRRLANGATAPEFVESVWINNDPLSSGKEGEN